MRIRSVLPGLHSISIKKAVNVFVIETDESLTLVDTGFPDSGREISEACATIGRANAKIRHIIATHCHNDHSGGLAELKRQTDATCYMHPLDAAMIRVGKTMRPCQPAPTVVGRMFYRQFLKDKPFESFDVDPVEIDVEINDGQLLDIAGGIEVIHAPGHCAGQVALLWQQHGGVLFAADIAANSFGLTLSPVYEDFDSGQKTLRQIASRDFDNACFGHGRPIIGDASAKFRDKWPSAV